MQSSVFVRREPKAAPGFSVGMTLNKKPVKGSVGLEVEVEGNSFPKPLGYEDTHVPMKVEGLNYWLYVKDGSLRGNDNAEYVLAKPIEFSEVKDALHELKKRLDNHGSVLDESNRTSVHVHLNCQDFHLNRLTSFMALYLALEGVLTEWCGDHRVGNLFCLRGVDAPYIVSAIRKFIRSDGKYQFSDHLHYGAMNVQALNKFGSLEFRTLRGVTDFAVIADWVSMLQQLYELSEAYTDPREVCYMFSGSGPMAFFNTALKDKAAIIRAGINWNEDQIKESIYDGIRLAQDICYCRDWSMFKPVEMQADPFGRSSKSIMKKILAEQGLAAELESEDNLQFAVSVQSFVNNAQSDDDDDDYPEPEYDDYEAEPEENGW